MKFFLLFNPRTTRKDKKELGLTILTGASAPLAVAILLTTMLLLSGRALAAEQTTCPVMGGKINKELFVDHDGKRIYFCCPACKPAFLKNPEKYLKALRDKDQEPEATPEAA